jgi:molybdopterin-binding protein
VAEAYDKSHNISHHLVYRWKEYNENKNQEAFTMISARNQFKGKIKSVKLGTVMAEIVVDTGAVEIVSIISRASAETMKLKAGDTVTAIIKSTEVMVAKE